MGKKKKYYKPREKKELPDTPERRAQLIKSYEGQIAYCYKRIARDEKKLASKKIKRYWKDEDVLKDIEHTRHNIEEWRKRIKACEDGLPLDFLGKKLGKEGSSNE